MTSQTANQRCILGHRRPESVNRNEVIKGLAEAGVRRDLWENFVDISFHYPPELFQLIVDCLPLLSRSKKDLLLFIRGSGVREAEWTDLWAKVVADKDSIKKHEIVRTVLTRLNVRGESALRERRELLKRIVEYEEFSSCWPDDALKARGLVSEIRRIVNVKDSFTRMKQERDAESEKTRREYTERIQRESKRKAAIGIVHSEWCSLFGSSDPHQRGIRFENVLNNMFGAYEVLVRESFRRRDVTDKRVVEQIDGVIEFESRLFLVEMKWLKEPAGVGDVSAHLLRLYHRNSTGAVFISASGYTKPAIDACRDSLQHAPVVLCTAAEIIRLMEVGGDLRKWFKKKLEHAQIDRNPFVEIMADR